MINNFYVCIALCLGAQTTSNSQTISQQAIDEVVVSDSRFELKRENSGKTVIKISRQEIENNQGRSVSALINSKSGIHVDSVFEDFKTTCANTACDAFTDVTIASTSACVARSI